jgi:integrase
MQRKKGDGSFRRLPNNSFEYAISVGNDIYGSRQRKFFYGKTEAECRKKYKDFMKGGDKQQIKAREYSLSKWLDEWLKIYKAKNVQASTYNEYVYLASHAKRHKIGGMKLSQIKPIHVTEFFTSLINYSHSIRKRMRFLLNAAFECAIDNDFCAKNPVRRAEIARKPQPEKEAFTEDEARTIIEFAKTDELFGVPIYILLNTGIRSGEMRALTTDKIDFENGVIAIDKAVKETGELGLPKNGKPRYIPIEDEVTAFLSDRIDRDAKYLIGDSYYVSKDGFRGRYEWFFKRLNLFLESNGKKPIKIKSPHSTRHTFGTLRQKSGMPIAMVSALLGHQSTEVTDKYTHLSDVTTLSEAVRKYPFIKPMAE